MAATVYVCVETHSFILRSPCDVCSRWHTVCLHYLATLIRNAVTFEQIDNQIKPCVQTLLSLRGINSYSVVADQSLPSNTITPGDNLFNLFRFNHKKKSTQEWTEQQRSINQAGLHEINNFISVRLCGLQCSSVVFSHSSTEKLDHRVSSGLFICVSVQLCACSSSSSLHEDSWCISIRTQGAF